MDAFGARLRSLRRKKGMTQDNLARVLGVARATIASWEVDRRQPDYATAQALADCFGVTLDYLIGGLVKPLAAVPFPPDALTDLARVPILGVIRAGEPILATENIEGYALVPAEDVKHGEHLFLRVRGDSMIGARIFEGDLVLVRRQEDVDDGDIAVVLVDDQEATLKRVYRANGTWLLQPENPNMRPIVVNKRDVRIIGRVIKVQFEVR